MSQGSITYTDTLKASFLKRYDQDGTVWIEAIAHAALTAKTPYKVIMNQYGHVTAAIADDVTSYYVGIPAASCSIGDKVWLQIGGEISDVITPSLSVTADHAFSILDGDVTDVGAAYTGLPGQFAACTTTSTSSTTQDMMLYPEKITGTT